MMIKKNKQMFLHKDKKIPFFLNSKIFKQRKVLICIINNMTMYDIIAILRIGLDKSKLLSPSNIR